MTEPIQYSGLPGGPVSDSAYTDQSNDECAAFQASMAERIGAGEDLQLHPHMLSCERCRSLVGDLEAIAAAVRELMPIDVEPDEDLWLKIEQKLTQDQAEQNAPDRTAPEEERRQVAFDVEGGLALEGGVA